MKKISLAHFFAGLLVFLISVPLALSVLTLNRHTATEYQAMLADQLSVTADKTKQTINAYLEGFDNETQLIASRNQMRRRLDRFNGTSGEADRIRINEIVQAALASSTRIDGVTLWGIDGRWVLSTDYGATDESLPPQGRRIVLDAAGHSLQLHDVQPIQWRGRMIGTVRVQFDGEFLNTIVRDRTGLHETGEWVFAVRDSQGDALYITPLKYDDDGAGNRRVSQSELNVPMTQALRGNDAFFAEAVDYMGTPVLAVSRYIEGLDMGLVGKIHQQEFEKITNDAFWWVGVMAAVVVAVCVSVGVLLIYGALRPFQRLVDTMKAFSETGLLAPYSQSSALWREVSDCVASYNDMVVALQASDRVLFDKIRQLNESNRALERFAYGASHDLKEPLRKVAMFASSLQGRCDEFSWDDTSRYELSRIVDGAKRMTAMIDALFALSKCTSARYAPEPTPLASLVKASMGDIDHLIEQLNATIAVETDVTLYVDPVLMQQVFVNLLLNSLCYSKPTEAPMITISSRTHDGFHEIEVADNGVGFDNQYAQAVFDPFTRLGDGSISGSGMGLAICMQIVNAHQGTIHVESEPWRGSRFTIRLPVEGDGVSDATLHDQSSDVSDAAGNQAA